MLQVFSKQNLMEISMTLSKEQFNELYTLIDTEQLTVCNDVENEVWNDIRRELRQYEVEDDYISSIIWP